jgi:hypothetical protein
MPDKAFNRTPLMVWWMVILLFAVVACAGPVKGPGGLQSSSAESEQLDSTIGPPVAEKYQAIRDAQDWLNPFLSVCPQGVVFSVRSLSRETKTIHVEELKQTLRTLPTQAWPYGRIVALSYCSIGNPGDKEAQQQRMRDVEAVLGSLELERRLWPS